MEGVHPLITYTSPDNNIEWHIHGGLAPFPGVQEGAYLVDGIKGLHPPFSQVEHKGARQDGVTNQRTVYDPAEYDMTMEFTAPPNQTDPGAAASAIRRVIRDWMESWDPKNPGTLSYITPEMGRWWCMPRLFRSPPDRQFKAQARRQRQRYTWTVRNDDCFWRGVDSVSSFHSVQDTTTTTTVTTQPPPVPGDGEVQVRFDQPFPGSIGPEWIQTYTGPGGGLLEVPSSGGAGATGVPGAVWAPSGTGARSVLNVLQGTNAVQTVAPYGGVPTGGHSNLQLFGNSTANIAHDATPAQVQTALQALPGVGSGNVAVSGATGGPYTVEFRNALGLQPIPLMTATSSLTGSAPPVGVGTAQPGASGAVASGATAVTLTTGELGQPPPGMGGTPGTPGDPVTDPSLSIFGWFDTGQTNGVKATVTSGGFAFISTIIGGVTSVLKVATGLIGSIANAAITLVAEVVQVAVGVFQQIVTLVVNGIKILVGIIDAVLGAVFKLIGFGLSVVGSVLGQLFPPAVTGIGAGGPVTTVSGELALTNFGDQDGYPRYLCYGPGTFKIANGPDSSEMVEFGPLVAGQIGLLTTLPRLRGVVDLTPSQPSLAVTPEFDNFVSRLISLAVNNNVAPLLEQFQSLFGMRPPQGVMYALLRGRFSKPIPPKPAGLPPTPAKIKVQILNGDASSKIIAALTPKRRWPE